MRNIGALAVALSLGLAACGRDGDDLGVTRSEIPVGEGRPLSATWSPDGSRIAYSKPVEGMAAIFVANADGSNAVRLTRGVWDVQPHWSPDGQWIAYHSDNPDHDLWVVPANGGEPRALTQSRTDDVPIGWLSDGSGVLYLRQGAGPTQTMIAPLDGGPVRPLVEGVRGNVFGAVSPDGRLAVLHVGRAGRTTLMLQDLTAGGEPRQLTDEGFEGLPNYRPWSSDSRYVLFTSRRTGTTDLWIADTETGELRQLTQDVRNDWGGVWSPDDQWVAFLSHRGGQTDVWVVAASGGQPRRVTADRAVESNLEWSADGSSILFTRFTGSSGLSVVSAEGGAPRELFNWPEAGMSNVEISPDGRHAVFQSNRSGVPDVWVAPLAGGEPTAIASSPGFDGQPRWSPDGRTIAFSSLRGGVTNIWTVPATGGEPTQLTDWPSFENWPVWSPDGSTIAFVSNRDADQSEVWTMPAAGGEATRLTQNGAAARYVAWSPDGRELLYVGAGRDGLHDLYRIPATGGTPRSFGIDARVERMDLSHDGQYLAYSVVADGWAFVDVLPKNSDSPRRLTPRSVRVWQEYVRWSPDGQRLVVTDYDYSVDYQDLYVVSWPGGEWRQLTNTPDANEFWAVWTPDGREILYVKARGDGRVVSVNVANVLREMRGN